MSARDWLSDAQWIFFAYFVGINVGYLALNLIATMVLRRYFHASDRYEADSVFSGLELPISLVAPAFNESVSVIASVKALLQLEYPEYELIVVNDGSSDDTLEKLIHAFRLRPFPEAYREVVEHRPVRGVYRSSRYPNLRVIDKENGGSKADAVNAGINACRYPLVCVVDCDSILQADSLRRVVRPFLEEPRTIAVGGTVRIANGCTVRHGAIERIALPTNFLALVQVVEYLRAFLFGRLGWSPLNALLIVSGAFGVFRRDVLLEVGGFNPKAVGEDMELIVRMHRKMIEAGRDYRISFIPDPVCWTDAPETLRGLKSQRVRWHHGLGQALFLNRPLMFNRRGGAVSWLAMPFYLLFELFGPLLELLGYIVIIGAGLMGWLTLGSTLLFLALALTLGILLSASAVMLEELSFQMYPKTRHVLLLFAVAIAENFGYRQLTLVWRIQGLFRWLLGRKHKWEHIARSDSMNDETRTVRVLPPE